MRRHSFALGTIVLVGVTLAAAFTSASLRTVGSGESNAKPCGSAVHVVQNAAYAQELGGYAITTVPLASGTDCAGMHYQVSLLGAGNVSLAERSGRLDASGAASPDFSEGLVAASAVTGIAVSISGTPRDSWQGPVASKTGSTSSYTIP
jgi:hypothetical protein